MTVKQVGKGSYGAALLVKLKIDPCVPRAARRAAIPPAAAAALQAGATLTRAARRAHAASPARLSSVLLVIKRVRPENAKERVSAQQEARGPLPRRHARPRRR